MPTDEINDFWRKNLLGHYLHDVNLNWSKNWRSLIDIESVYTILARLFSSRLRLDHIFCADENFISAGGKMHHQADMFEDGVFYFVKSGKIFNGLTGVLYALSDMNSGASHLCCIPASHRANFSVPDEYRNPNSNPLIKHIFLTTGDALIFSRRWYMVPTMSKAASRAGRYSCATLTHIPIIEDLPNMPIYRCCYRHQITRGRWCNVSIEIN